MKAGWGDAPLRPGISLKLSARTGIWDRNVIYNQIVKALSDTFSKKVLTIKSLMSQLL